MRFSAPGICYNFNNLQFLAAISLHCRGHIQLRMLTGTILPLRTDSGAAVH